MVKVLLYLLLFFLPTQLGKHFWFDWSYKVGMRVDYLAPTVYLTDVLAVVIILIFFGRMAIPKTAPLRGQPQGLPLRLIGGIVILLMVGWWLFVVGENPWLLAYNLGRLGVLGLLGYVIAKTFKKEDFPQIITVLNWALILQVFLAAYQVIVERSADLWILGERSFGIVTPGIARFMAPGGQLLLRGYGTFPHPNVLGGFCLLMLVGNSLLFLRGRLGKLGRLGRFGDLWVYLIGFLFSLLGVWLSMSVLAIVLSQVFLAGLVLLIRRCLTRRAGAKTALLRGQPQGLPLRLILLVVSVIILAAGIWYLVSGNSDSISRRLTLLQYSWQMFKASPVFGVGLGNFIPMMPEKPVGNIYFWQPVHNVLMLIGTELGLAGIAIVSLLIWKGIRKLKVKSEKLKIIIKSLKISENLLITHYPLFIIISWWLIIFITGLFDHYWLTIQQGRLMLVMVIGLTFAGASSSKKLKR